jgi:propionyl-CoA carboxylase alpha chain/3-methylcrotonyl-CoA carboxylase alpha subunit
VIRRLLIANRGEIARRIIRTCRRLGVETVAVYSDADAQAPHVREADQAVRLGPPPARESYLRQDLILEAARSTGADAIHPGYGFLSENAEFAEAVAAAGLVWVGPPPSAIRAMGLKDAAKTLMAEAGVPTTPGYLGEDQSEARLQAEADRIGYPVLIKAGGRAAAARVCARSRRPASSSPPSARPSARRRRRSAMTGCCWRPMSPGRGTSRSRFSPTARQRRPSVRARLLAPAPPPEGDRGAPAPGMDAATREAVTGAAVRAAQAVGYEGAGTVEFIADASEGLRPDRIFFMEMNTRLQVEHPVTEMITGQDLVEWQLRVASGEPLPLRQDQLSITGHAMEARLYAENPATGFLPSTGRLEHFVLPQAETVGEGAVLRIDSAVEQGGEVSVFYDPMIAKLISHGPNRESAAELLADACREVEVWPVRTNAAFMARCLDHPDFLAGEVDTSFIPVRQDALAAAATPSEAAVEDAVRQQVERLVMQNQHEQPHSPWNSFDGLAGFRLNGVARLWCACSGARRCSNAPSILTWTRSWAMALPPKATSSSSRTAKPSPSPNPTTSRPTAARSPTARSLRPCRAGSFRSRRSRGRRSPRAPSW